MATTTELRSAADRLIELHEAGDLDAVLTLADEVARMAGALEASDDIVRESLFVARFQRAMALTERHELAQAAGAYADAAATPTDLDDPDQRHEVAMALLHQGMCLDALDAPEEAVAVYADIVRRFGAADDPVTRDQVVRARVNGAVSHLNAGAVDVALEQARDLIDELDPSLPLDAEQWIMARRIAAAALAALERPDDAIDVLVAAGVADLDDEGVREQQAQAHLDRGRLLDELGRSGAAAEARQAADAIAVS